MEEHIRQVQIEHLQADIEQISAAASHDLRDQLRLAATYCENLRSLAPVGALNLINSIESCIEDTIEHVQALRKYSHLAQNPGEMEDVDLLTLIRKAEKHVRETVFPMPWQLQVTEGQFPIRAKQGQLVELFTELFINALKFNQRMSPEIEVKIHLSGHHYMVEVIDNGIGMEPEYKEYVFGLFKRVNPDVKTTGTGAGLAMCRRIVFNHLGGISLESEAGYGCRFIIMLPIGDEG